MAKTTIVVDLGFGDAGKGTIVDFISRRTEKPPITVRFNGGGQAAHNVITPTGQHHTFAQFGSGSFISGSQTFLSRFMLVDPMTLAVEAAHLNDIGCGNPFNTLHVDADAMVVTPYQKLVNRARESERGAGRHGSCGMGIGETMALHESNPELTVRVSDLRDDLKLAGRLTRLREWATELYPHIGDQYTADDQMRAVDRMWITAGRFATVSGAEYLAKTAKQHDLIFEGSQGVLIDETYGFHPHTTWSTTTFKNAETLLSEIGYAEPVERLGVLRAYGVRHGPGPFPTEDADLTALLPERHNSHGEWQGVFRIGHFDAVLARYAIEVCGGVDSLAITCLDRVYKVLDRLKIVGEYRHDGGTLCRLKPVQQPTLMAQAGLGHFVEQCTPIRLNRRDETVDLAISEYVAEIECQLGVPIFIHSYGPTAIDKTITPGRS